MVEKLLDNLLDVLKRERHMLLKAAFDSGVLSELESILEEKRILLKNLSELDADSLVPFGSKLKEIERFNKRNEALALSQLGFIEGVMEAVLQGTKYNSSGEVERERGSFFNKKI